MKHIAVDQFWERYRALPIVLQKHTDSNFAIIKQHPNHPLLRLLEVEGFISMRIGSRHRALAVREQNRTVWFWIGTYHQYKQLVP
jgi:hypothetical protein